VHLQLRKQVADVTEKQRSAEREREAAEQKVIEVIYTCMVHHSTSLVGSIVADEGRDSSKEPRG
jgi:hypothetical protein